MLEIARALSKDYKPRCSIMFMAAGAEEMGVAEVEGYWSTGAAAFVNAHPEIMRNLTYLFNVDLPARPLIAAF